MSRWDREDEWIPDWLVIAAAAMLVVCIAILVRIGPAGS